MICSSHLPVPFLALWTLEEKKVRHLRNTSKRVWHHLGLMEELQKSKKSIDKPSMGYTERISLPSTMRTYTSWRPGDSCLSKMNAGYLANEGKNGSITTIAKRNEAGEYPYISICGQHSYRGHSIRAFFAWNEVVPICRSEYTKCHCHI